MTTRIPALLSALLCIPRLRPVQAGVIVSVLAACAAPAPVQDTRLRGPQAGDLQRILALPRPPRVVIAAGQKPRLSPRTAARLTDAALSEQRGSRRIEIAAVPMLRSTIAGGNYLATSGPRALAKGEPREMCPALTASLPGAPTPVAAAENALTRCAELLRIRGAAASCGCRLVALDDALLAPIGQFAFAPAVSALVINKGQATRLIAEADLAEGVALIRLRNSGGEVGILRRIPGQDRVDGTLFGIEYAGETRPFGFRRGRLAERLSLSSDNGDKISILIGVERRDATR